jgi:hypothetical protein
MQMETVVLPSKGKIDSKKVRENYNKSKSENAR